MGSGTDKRDNEQNKMAGQIDKAMKRERENGGEKRISASERFRLEYQESKKPKTFEQIYPNIGGWEIEISDLLNRRNLPLSEINEVMHTTGLAARDWVREHYTRKVEPKDVARIIKNLFR
jgi:hypothetical protein